MIDVMHLFHLEYCVGSTDGDLLMGGQVMGIHLPMSINGFREVVGSCKHAVM